jgi:hypothetical protein
LWLRRDSFNAAHARPTESAPIATCSQAAASELSTATPLLATGMPGNWVRNHFQGALSRSPGGRYFAPFGEALNYEHSAGDHTI